MRTKRTTDGLRVNAVAGTYVVLLGIDLPEGDCDGLLGFSIRRHDRTTGDKQYLLGMKPFEATTGRGKVGYGWSTEHHPVQSFQWADYDAEPGHDYTYTVTALKGAPESIQRHARTAVRVTTESPANGLHDIYFNRGVAASQRYARRFDNRPPGDFADGEAHAWLSRGLYEAMEDFITSCEPGRHALRIAAYEWRYDPLLVTVKRVVDDGVDVQVVYDARGTGVRLANEAAVARASLEAVSRQRTRPASYISHNKFIVKLDSGVPVAVWTGGTNFSEGGIFGHSNVAHVVEDSAVAQQFLEYWEALAEDPDPETLKERVEAISPLPTDMPPPGTTVVFSPRRTLEALDWYAQLAMRATNGFFMTFAFGMNDTFKAVYRDSSAPFRMALMERLTRPMRPGAERNEEEACIQELRNLPANLFAVGSLVAENALDRWVRETLSGLNKNVMYVHNKFMLVDPLSNDPIVVAGSANFSDASVRRNDENMIVVRGDTRVADVYLGEFMRLYAHHAYRESRQWATLADPARRWLRTDDWWRPYYDDPSKAVRRGYFAGTLP